MTDSCDPEYSTNTMRDAVQIFMACHHSDSDIDVILNCEKENIDSIHPDFTRVIMSTCELRTNKALRMVCGNGIDISPTEASRVIMGAIWEYFQTGIEPVG